MSSKVLFSGLAFAVFVAACGQGGGSQGGSSPAVPTPGGAPVNAAPSPGRVTSTDSVARVPTFLWAEPHARLPVQPASAADAARQHIARFAQRYRLDPSRVDELELRDLHDTGRGAVIARFGRRIGGVEVFGEQLAVTMDRSWDVVALSGFVTGDLPAAAKLPGSRAADAFKLDAFGAMTRAMSDLSGVAVGAGDFEAPAPARGDYLRAPLNRAGALRTSAHPNAEPTRAKRVFYRVGEDSLVAAYYVEADLGNGANREQRSYAYLISADDGRILAKHNLVAYDNPVTYRVYADSSGLFTPWDGPNGTSPTPSATAVPDGFQPPFVPAQLVTLSSLTAVGVLDPWLPPGASETLGNNVDAYVDLSSPDGFTPGSSDFRGTTSSPATFDYVFDTSLDANASLTQRQAALTQLFYNVNWFHDWYYAAGFTETAGNAQFSNYGRGGIEGDGLRAEAQDFGGFNNANMNTPADGARPRMQMFLWTKPLDLHLATGQLGTFTNLGTAVFGPLSFNIAADIVQANPVDACAPLVGDYTGKIVFVDRGGPVACNGFAGKTERVQAAGAAGIIIANVATSVNPGIPPAMGGTPSVPITIAVVSMNLSDGNLFRTAFANQQALSGTLVRVTQLLDGDIDNQIVAHEWGHYISNRLIFNSAGLQNNMSRGLGEGWADFHAMLITVREEDTQVQTNDSWQGTYALAGYATSTDPNSYYFGIRRYPYSTDTGKNPLTFKHISDVNPLPTTPAPNFNGTNSEVHNTGEIWTTMLWESYAALLRDTLGPTPRLSFAEARDRMRDYIVAAYKVTPANPTLLEARDALLLVASINDPADSQLIGAAFAKRGAGVYAVAPPRGENTNTPVLESFAFGAAVDQTGATLLDDGQVVCNGADGILDDGETGTLRVTFRNVGNADTPQLTATATTGTSGITFPGGPDLVIPPIPRGGTAVATLQVAASGLAANTTISITVSTPDAGSGGSTTVTYAFAGNADEVAGQSSTDSAERSVVVWSQVPNPSTLPPDSVWQKVSTSPSNHAYACRSANTTATVDLISPLFFVPTGQTLALSFRYRHSLERDAINNLNFDGAVVEFSLDNGATWTDVFTLPGSGVPYTGFIASGNPLQGRPGFTGTSAGYPAFLPANVNLGASFGGQSVRLRFRVASDSGVGSPGLEIDDIQVSGTAAPLFAGLIPQSPTCNAQPVANAGANQTVNEFGPGPTFTPTTVFLDGSASIDPNGDPLTYQWTQISGPGVTLSDPHARIPSFVTPQVPRTPASTPLIFQLVVNDGTISSAAKLTQVTVVNVNRPPVAVAHGPASAPERTVVTLDGTASSDPDTGDTLTYSWTAPAGITLSSATAAQPTFTAPEVTADTQFTFTLTVSDGLATSAPASVTVTVTNVNRPPTANAGPDFSARDRTLVQLHGSGTDPDGDPITFHWTAPAGILLIGAHHANPIFLAPKVKKDTPLTFSLVVTDSHGAQSAPDTVVVTIRKH